MIFFPMANRLHHIRFSWDIFKGSSPHSSLQFSILISSNVFIKVFPNLNIFPYHVVVSGSHICFGIVGTAHVRLNFSKMLSQPPTTSVAFSSLFLTLISLPAFFTIYLCNCYSLLGHEAYFQVLTHNSICHVISWVLPPGVFFYLLFAYNVVSFFFATSRFIVFRLGKKTGLGLRFLCV